MSILLEEVLVEITDKPTSMEPCVLPFVMSEADLAYERRPLSKQKYRLCQPAKDPLSGIRTIQFPTFGLTLQRPLSAFQNIASKLEWPILKSLTNFQSLQNLPFILITWGKLLLACFSVDYMIK